MSGKENVTEVGYGVKADVPIRQLPSYSKQPKRGLGPPSRTAPRARGRGRDNGRFEQRKGNRRGVREDRKEVAVRSPWQQGTGEGKKSAPTSLNHLLNFTVVGGERCQGNSLPTYNRRRRSQVTHAYNKEQFLQSNCQFVVASSGDYDVHSTEPDRLVDWQRIEQVRLFCHEIPSCPICLYPPRAAKITRCGHVFCWSCVLHYLSLGDKKWRKCPICYESIYRTDLRSVAALASAQYGVGDTIAMTLMRREKGSIRVVPKSQWTAQTGPPSLEDGPGNQYVKLLLATPSQVLGHITSSERDQLTSQLANLGADEASERCFIESALEELKARELCLKQSATVAKEVAELTEGLQVDQAGSTDGTDQVKGQDSPEGGVWSTRAEGYFEQEFEDPFSEEEDEEEGWSGNSEDSPQGPAKPLTTVDVPSPSDSSPELPVSQSHLTASPGGSIYFYQASDGQHLYLHPINARCLAKEYGGLEHCPDTITARVVEMEQLSMTEETRTRYRYLSHLPLTCELALCELDLRPPVLSRETLRQFAEDLQRRRQRRQKKKRDERRRERQVSPPRGPVLGPVGLSAESLHDLLSVTISPPLTLSPPPRQAGQGSEVNLPVQSSGPSFAQALRGRPTGRSPTAQPPQQPGAEGEEGSYVAPSFHEAFNQALVSADAGGRRGSKTARKGRKKLVLFSTEGARGTS